MTVSATTAQQTFNCNGSTASFVCPFRVLDASEMRAYLVTISTGATVELTNGTEFTVSGVGDANAVVSTVAVYGSAYQLKCVRNTALLQLTDYRDNDPFPAESHELALDRLTHIAQESRALADRALVFPEPEDGYILPQPAGRANRLITFDADGAAGVSAYTSGQVAAAISALTTGETAGTVVQRETVTATAGQTVVTFSTLTYTPGVNGVVVVLDGQLVPVAGILFFKPQGLFPARA